MIPSEASVVLESSQEEVTPLVDQRVSSSKYQKEGQKPLVKDNNSNSDLLVPKKEEPPPAATVCMRIIGARIRTPATSVSKLRSYCPA